MKGGETHLRTGERYISKRSERVIKRTLAAAVATSLVGCGVAKPVDGEARPIPSNSRTAEPTTPQIVTPTVRKHQPSPSHANAVYFQPRLANLKDPNSQIIPEGVYKMVAEPGQSNSWTSSNGRCNPENAHKFKDVPGITRITAFSLGRIGLPYALQGLTYGEEAPLNYALIIAPGNKADLTEDSCDPHTSGAGVAEWLGANPERRLTFLADARTAEDDHAGIRALYLDDPAILAVKEQVSVCTSNLPHEEAWNAFKAALVAPPIDTPAECPTGSTWLPWR